MAAQGQSTGYQFSDAGNFARPVCFAPLWSQNRDEGGKRSGIFFEDGSKTITSNEQTVFQFASCGTLAKTMHAFPSWHPSCHAKVKLASGKALLVDTRAVEHFAGDQIMFRMSELSAFQKLDAPLAIDGVGKAPSGCTQHGTVPIVLSDGIPALYKAPMINNSSVSALLGLNTMSNLRVLLDLAHNQYIMVGQGGFELEFSPGSEVLYSVRAPTGHLMFSASEWSRYNGNAKTIALNIKGCTPTAGGKVKQALLLADMEHARIKHESVSYSITAKPDATSKQHAKPTSTQNMHDQDVVVHNDELNTVGIISDSIHTNNFIKLDLAKVEMSCTYMLISSDLQPTASHILTMLKEERLNLVRFATLPHDAIRPVESAVQCAVRIIASEQHSQQGHFLAENCSMDSKSRGILKDSSWISGLIWD